MHLLIVLSCPELSLGCGLLILVLPAVVSSHYLLWVHTRVQIFFVRRSDMFQNVLRGDNDPILNRLGTYLKSI